LFPPFLDLISHANLYGALGIGHGWQFQNGDKFLWFAAGPSVTAFGIWMAVQVKNPNMTIPNRFANENLMDWNSVTPLSGTVVQVFDCEL
jgi:hypothetical protein